MIITISGVACTGKTTLLEAIKTEISSKKKIYYHEEFIREIFSEKYANKYKDYEELLSGDPIDIIDIHKETAKRFNDILWSSNLNNILIFDRCPLDASIYMYINLKDHITNDSHILSRYREASRYIYHCSENFLKYSPVILYTRPFNEGIENDGFRPDTLIKDRSLEISLFDKEFLSLPDVHILPDKLEDRVYIIDHVINSI